MREYVGQRIRADRGNVGGMLYFYADRLVWTPRHYRYNSLGFEVQYSDIVTYEVMQTHKKRLDIVTKDDTYFVELYHIDLAMMWIDAAVKDAKGESPKVVEAQAVEPTEKKEDDLDALARLAALHKSGALTDDEFKAMKAKIINGK